MTDANATVLLLLDNTIGIWHWPDIADDVLATAETKVVSQPANWSSISDYSQGDIYMSS